MKNADEKISDLIKRHAFLRYSSYKDDSRVIRDAMDRIEREYIVLTGYEIAENEEHKKLLIEYNQKLKNEGLI